MKNWIIVLAAASGMAGCTTAPPKPDPAAVLAASQVNAAAATNVGPGSKAGFCTFKDPSGKLFEKKC